MTIENLEIRKEFVKFFNLPFPMVEHNYAHYIKALDPYYKTIIKLNDFNNAISKYDNVQDFLFSLKNSKSLIHNLFNEKNNDDMSAIDNLKAFDFSQYQAENLNIAGGDIYKIPNVGNHYISVDLKHANFQSLKFIAKKMKEDNSFSKIMKHYNTYEDLFILTNSDPFFAKSKNLRQYIFGLLEPKKQQFIQKYIMGLVYQKILEPIHPDKIVALNSDELIIQVEFDDIDENLTEISKALLLDNFLSQFKFHVDYFQLCRVGEQHKFFYKKNKNNIEFKCVPKNKLMEVIAKYEGREATCADKLFIFDGRLAIYQDNLFD